MKFYCFSIVLVLICEVLNISMKNKLGSQSLSFSDLFLLNLNKNGLISDDKMKMKVYVIHQGNNILHEGKSINFKINYDKEGNILFNAKVGSKKIHLGELYFIEGKSIFNLEEVEKIATESFKNFLNKNFIQGISKLAQTDENLKEHALCIFHHKREGANETFIEKDLAVVFRPTDDDISNGSAQRQMETFKKKFMLKYHQVTNDWENLHLNLPDMMEHLDNHFTYWNSLDNFQQPATYYVSLADEGVVLNQISNHTIQTVRLAFRYDQIFECDGTKNATDAVSAVHLQKSLPIPSCCVGYNVNWEEKPAKELFCSTSKSATTCENQINIFKKFVYKKCVETGVNRLGRIIVGNQSFTSLTINIKIQFKLLVITIKRYSIFTKIINLRIIKKYLIIVQKNIVRIEKILNELLIGVRIDEILGNYSRKLEINVSINNNMQETSKVDHKTLVLNGKNEKIDINKKESVDHSININVNLNNNTNSVQHNNKINGNIDVTNQLESLQVDQSTDTQVNITNVTEEVQTVYETQLVMVDSDGNVVTNSSNFSTNGGSTQTSHEVVIKDSSDPNAYMKIAEEQEKLEHAQDEKGLVMARNTAGLSKKIIQLVEKKLGRDLNTQEVIIIISLVDNDSLKGLFLEIVRRNLDVPYEIVVKFNQLGFEGVADFLKKYLSEGDFKIKKSNLDYNFNCTQNPHPVTNITTNTNNTIPTNNHSDADPDLPVDTPTAYSSDDDSFHSLGKECNKNSPIPIPLNKDVPKDKKINLPEIIKQIERKVETPEHKKSSEEKPKKEKDKAKVIQTKLPLKVEEAKISSMPIYDVIDQSSTNKLKVLIIKNKANFESNENNDENNE